MCGKFSLPITNNQYGLELFFHPPVVFTSDLHCKGCLYELVAKHHYTQRKDIETTIHFMRRHRNNITLYEKASKQHTAQSTLYELVSKQHYTLREGIETTIHPTNRHRNTNTVYKKASKQQNT